MKLEILELPFLQEKLHFWIEDNRYLIEYLGRLYSSLEELIENFPSLFDPSNALLLAMVSNFLYGGLDFAVIKDLRAYKEKYASRMRQEAAGKAEGEFTISQYGRFDLSEMHPPEIRSNQLTFYVESSSFGIPYKAICLLPASGRKASCSYSLLKSESIHP
jgi:hypothetical protein